MVKNLGILRSVRFPRLSSFSAYMLTCNSVGGSTIVVLFEKGMVQWDEDLLINGRAALETLVRVGMGIGRGRSKVA